MRCIRLFSFYILLLSPYVISMDLSNSPLDPFHKANDLYALSDWENARHEYATVDFQLKMGVMQLHEDNDFHNFYKIRGYVNYADVLHAHGATEWKNGNYA